MEVTITNPKNEKVGTINIEDSILNTQVNKGSIWEVVKWQLSARRAGTASTKTRAEVRGSRRKILPQKGTGNARHGDKKANIFVGGGIVHGPRPRDFYYPIPKKLRKKVLKGVLTIRYKDGDIKFIEDFTFEKPKTKTAIEFLKDYNILDKKVLIVIPQKDENITKSFRNLPKIKILLAEGLNTYDILNADIILITKTAAEKINERLAQ
ncbi:MAG: 50S ribosomal protein L4 [Aquificae bacterium]|nr:50S ribosomal protein L4 [Aquificota bacterium]